MVQRREGGSIAYSVGTIDPSNATNMHVRMPTSRPMPPSLLGGGTMILRELNMIRYADNIHSLEL
jgi:hypothetical protein